MTTILLDGKRVRLELWDTSGQGRFCTILRSYSRGAQGILLVYDITSRWSFDGINRWIKEIDEHAPGVPKILIGNRLHLAYKRQVSSEEAQIYAIKNDMEYFEVSSLCDYNVTESLTELSRVVLNRNGMERLWRTNKGEGSMIELGGGYLGNISIQFQLLVTTFTHPNPSISSLPKWKIQKD